MNFEHYKNFIIVAESQNISAAAEHLHIAQSALSSQIRSFEEEFGAQLLVRGPRTIELTDAGRIFYTAAKNMARLDEAAHKEIRDCAQGRRGTLKLGMTSAFPDEQLELLLESFAKENPFVSYELYEASSAELAERLKNGVIEVAVVRTPSHLSADLVTFYTSQERFYAYFSPGLLEDSPEPLPIDALKDVPISIPRCFRSVITEAFRLHNIEPTVFSVSTSRRATMLWAEKGAAVALLSSDPVAPFRSDRLLCRQIGEDTLRASRAIVALRGRTLSSIAQSFLTSACWTLSHMRYS